MRGCILLLNELLHQYFNVDLLKQNFDTTFDTYCVPFWIEKITSLCVGGREKLLASKILTQLCAILNWENYKFVCGREGKLLMAIHHLAYMWPGSVIKFVCERSYLLADGHPPLKTFLHTCNQDLYMLLRVQVNQNFKCTNQLNQMSDFFTRPNDQYFEFVTINGSSRAVAPERGQSSHNSMCASLRACTMMLPCVSRVGLTWNDFTSINKSGISSLLISKISVKPLWLAHVGYMRHSRPPVFLQPRWWGGTL